LVQLFIGFIALRVELDGAPMRTDFQGLILLFVAVVAAAAKGEIAAEAGLHRLVESRFGKLSLAEESLVRAVAEGEKADCGRLSGEDRIIRGDLFSWICTDRNSSAQLTHRGVSLVGAEIVKELNLEWAKISFPITASQCVFKDTIILSHSRIAFLSLADSSVNYVEAGAAHFQGDVYFSEDFKAANGVDLTAAKIDGDLVCDRGQFIGRSKTPALVAKGVEVKGSVFLRHIKAEGGVDLASARIDGNLECAGGEFVGNDKAPALNAHDAKIEGNVFLSKCFKAEGNIIFFGAYVGRAFRWFGVESPEKVKLDLRQARVGTLLNSQDSWPTQGKLYVDGFVYDQIDGRDRPNDDQIEDRARPTAEVQLRWLQLQAQDRFLSQPFEQLAGVLRKMGLEEDAPRVMIAKNEEHARYVQWRLEWLWYGLFGHLIGYGYSPWNAFGISLIVIVIGRWLFRRGYRRGLVTPTGGAKYTIEKDGAHPSSDDYPKFNAFVYSLETFVPIVKLGIGEHWTPNANARASANEDRLRFPPKTGGWLRGYLWFHIIAGWVLTTLWVGGLTGLVKT
jgi:hypothetical protein